MKKLIIFFLILVLAAFLRFYKLNEYPPSLNWDEVSIGYNAYSILKTGRDEWGQILPLSFRAYGDYKLPGYIYLDTVFIRSFGLNAWGVRLPSAVLGLGIVVFIFLTVKKLINTNLALWAMFTAAVTPWLIILSRIALEANLALFFTTGSIYFLILGFKRKYFLLASSFFLGLSLFSYNSSRVVVIPLVITAAVLFWKKINNIKVALFALGILAIFFITAFPLALLQDSSARYKWTTILDQGAVLRINELRGSAALPPVLDKLIYNKITYFIPQSLGNYFSHFNPNFLFFNGGSNYQYSVPGSGLFHLSLLPFLILGIYQIFRKKENWQFFILGWLIIALVPAAITRDAPHALRALLMIPPFLIISVLGVGFVTSHFKPTYVKALLAIFTIALVFQSVQFWKNYTGDYVKNYSWSWQYGYREAVDFVNKEANQYDRIYFTKKYGEPHEFVLFYLKIDPQFFRGSAVPVRYKKSDWYWVDSFDKFEFINDWEIKGNVKCETKSEKCLMVTSPGNYPEGWKFIKKIDFLDGKPAFDIVEI
ncbi:glycosyltransferase family 39 protein [Candidatus Daviesbacteria bacterium]|nr:glycosyltransferase family 39 protein [Candidatus Daviesbacteria bacterium]